MTGLRTPVVIGLHPRAGTSTVAAALHAHEGSSHDGPADVVCVGEHALPLALSLVTPPVPPLPVLAIAAGVLPGPPLPGLGSRFGAVVLIPHLVWWAGAPAQAEEMATLLGLPAERLPPPLRAYAAALRAIAAALVHSGQLTRGSAPLVVRPPAVARPAPGGRAPAHRPIRAVLPAPAEPRGFSAPPALDGSSLDILDDDALEAAGFAAARRAG